jgi:hypothetical protein
VNFENTSFPFAPDLHNPCNGATYANLNAALAVLDGSEIVTIDPDGELITAYVFADNYFEMYISGVPVGKDKAPYTQFNSSLLRFRVKRPFSIAMLLVDWEEHLGLGTEANGPSPYHAGDGGMVAVFKNESGDVIAKTNNEWKAQTFYTAPVKNLACLTETGNQRLSTTCDTQDGTDGSAWYGVHWSRPANWMQSDFDQSVKKVTIGGQKGRQDRAGAQAGIGAAAGAHGVGRVICVRSRGAVRGPVGPRSRVPQALVKHWSKLIA